MTETEWHACDDLWEMLEFLKPRADDRKLRLFGVACCRRAWHLMTDPKHRAVVEAAECRAQGSLSKAGFDEVIKQVVEMWHNPPYPEGNWDPSHYMTSAARHMGGGISSGYAASFVARGLACLTGDKESPLARHGAGRTGRPVLVAPRPLRRPIPPLPVRPDG